MHSLLFLHRIVLSFSHQMESFSPEVVVNSFAVDFFETLAKNPKKMSEKFSSLSSVLFDDFQLGAASAEGEEVSEAFQRWATAVADSKVIVDLVRGATTYGGMTAFINFHSSNGLMNDFFQMNAILESVVTFDASNAYYIRHLTISRVGAVAVEVPNHPPTPEVVEEEIVKAPSSAPTPAGERTPAQLETPRAVEAAPVEEAEPEIQVPPTEPGTWRARMFSPLVKADERKVVRVAATSGTTATKVAAPRREGVIRKDSPKGIRRSEKKPSKAFGDRLMFSTDGPLQDDDIRAALGPLAASLLSLRNVSVKGHVFIDFAEGVKAFEELQKGLFIGASKKKIGVFRQKPRENRDSVQEP